MNKQLILLLARDQNFESTLRKALPRNADILVQQSVGGALESVCFHRRNLGLVIADFDDGCHGMTLLGALKMLDDKLPIIATMSKDAYHASAVAYANGASACVAKPITAAELKLVLEDMGHAKLELMAA